jgi:hypothetical protein
MSVQSDSGRRGNARVFVNVQGASGKFPGYADDISLSEISVFLREPFGLFVGEYVAVASDRLGAVEGNIRWIRKNHIGIEFDHTTNNRAKVSAFLRGSGQLAGSQLR